MEFYEVRCLIDELGWKQSAQDLGYRVMLSRSGAHLRRVNGRVSFADATSVLLTRPGDEMHVAHPLGHGDTYTCLELPADVLAARPDAQGWLDRRGWEGQADDRLDLEHRMLVADCRRGLDPFETAERIHGLLTGLLAGTDPGTDPDADLDRAVGRRPATLTAHRRLADRARQVLAGGGLRLGLAEVARQVGCSPHHLSRVFRRVTGQSLTGYRNRLRVRSVLDTLADGGPSLGTLAVEHGFADQAHLSRVVRQQVGHPPARLRRMLTAHESQGLGRRLR
jgi:AraC-like DNA-binding protein